MSDTTSPAPEQPGGVAGVPDPGTYAAPGASYTAPNPYVAQNPYVTQNPYVAPNPYAAPAAAPATSGPAAPAAPAASPYAAPVPYQPNPTVPAPYAPPPYTVGGAAYSYAPRTNPLAITSLVLSLAGFLTWISAIGGVVTGHIALSQIKRTGEGGRGMAIAGLVVGYVMVAFMAIYLLFIIAWFATPSSGGWL